MEQREIIARLADIADYVKEGIDKDGLLLHIGALVMDLILTADGESSISEPEEEEETYDSHAFGHTSHPPDSEGRSDDDLLQEAIPMVVRMGSASASLLQRKLRIGYARASRLVDIMEQMGVVDRPEGNKPRDVLLSEDQLATHSGDPASSRGRFVGTSEACQILGIGDSRVKELCRDGELDAYKADNVWRISEESVLRRAQKR